ncbi:hypothetical protein HZY83_05370 [Gemella sp. GH3]|uniref:TcpE family conjugal transfer membrane protein n=1 Tax=unclassified Gemella TaxID=2624949 RepID=UPI0015D077AE|nr:hypothetical protein [Gemella sp. GH3.1]NYS51053.1 hypothetical protein [Gemella sp. GH3]
MKDLYNYTKAWRSPHKLYNFKNWIKFRNGIKFLTIAIFILLCIIFYFINNIIHFTKYIGLTYWSLPIILTYYIATRNVDGKNSIIFLYDYIVWKYSVVYKNRVYSYDKEVLYIKKNNRFI